MLFERSSFYILGSRHCHSDALNFDLYKMTEYLNSRISKGRKEVGAKRFRGGINNTNLKTSRYQFRDVRWHS